MNTNSLINIIDELDFRRALRRVKYDSEYDFIRMPVEMTIFEESFDENIKFLLDSIRKGDYTVKSLSKMWVPKKNFFLRPGSIPQIEDRILFQALVDNIAKTLEELLPSFEEGIVFSSRLNPDENSESLFRHPRDLWITFQKKAVEYCQTPGINHVLISDIASYFENIDLRQLNDTLSSSGINFLYTDNIRQILLKWANGRTRGLPQMIAPCSLLANVYLSQVDKAMLRRGYNYIRYVDDIRIFVQSETELKQALYDLTEQLKDCYLDVQASKTKFQTAQEHERELTLLDHHLAEVGIELEEPLPGSYSDGHVSKTRVPEVKLLAFLNELLENPNYDDRHLRYCINRLGSIGSPAAKGLVLSKLVSMPQETGTFVQYLLRLSPDEIDVDTVRDILDFLSTRDNIYDWQIMWLLILLGQLPKILAQQLSRLFRIEVLKRHPVNRALLSYLLCKHGDLALKREYMSKHGQESSHEVQMAIMCGVVALEKQERNRFYENAAKDRKLKQLAKMLKNKPVPFI